MVSEKIRLPADAKLRWLNLIYIKLLRVGEFQKEIGKPKEPPAPFNFYARKFFWK